MHIVHLDQEFGGTVAKQIAAEFHFKSLGEVTHAVILRLSSGLPRIRCEISSTVWRGLEEISQ